MTTAELMTLLANDGWSPTNASDRVGSFGRGFIRGTKGCRVVGAIGGDQTPEDQVNGLVDVLAFRHQRRSVDSARLIIGSRQNGRATAEVSAALASQYVALRDPGVVEVWSDSTPIDLRSARPDFSRSGLTWCARIVKQEAVQLPELAKTLKQLVDRPSFQWYRTVTAKCWSGRVEGLEVCKVTNAGHGVVKVGRVGKVGGESVARKFFLTAAGRKIIKLPDQLDTAASVIQALADARETGELRSVDPEHWLESRVLRGEVSIEIPLEGALTPLTATPFQFPTQWATTGKPKYVDLLMRLNGIPWIVELKVATGGQRQYYRHAIRQSILYRQYIRSATPVHGWLAAHGVNGSACEAAVAFPSLRKLTTNAEALRHELKAIAEHFSVQIIELGDTDNGRAL